MKRILFIIPPENFHDEELHLPRMQLTKIHIHTAIASLKTGAVAGIKGTTVQSDMLIDQAEADDYDVFVIVGGPGTEKYLLQYLPLTRLLKKAADKKKILAGLGTGVAILGDAGVLKNKMVTTPHVDKYIHDVKKWGAVYSDEEIVVSDHIITTDGVASAFNFGKILTGLLNMDITNKITSPLHESVTIPLNTPFNDI